MNDLIKPIVLDQTLADWNTIFIKKIENDKNFPFKKVITNSPLKAIAFYSFNQKSKEEQQRVLKKSKEKTKIFLS